MLFEKEDFKSAAKLFKQLIKSDENNSDALYKLGICYVELNKMREAKKILNNLYYIDMGLYDSLNIFIN